MSKFDSHYPRIQVGRESVNVVVKLRTSTPALATNTASTLSAPECNDACINAFVLLRSKTLIPPVLLTSITPEQKTILETAESAGLIGLNISESGILIV